MSENDIFVQIRYDISEPRKTVIRTNAKLDKIGEVLEAWLISQIGQGQDLRESDKKNEYNISIKLDLIGDNFYTISDTGNSGLTAGIVMHVSQNLDKLQISPLS